MFYEAYLKHCFNTRFLIYLLINKFIIFIQFKKTRYIAVVCKTFVQH